MLKDNKVSPQQQTAQTALHKYNHAHSAHNSHSHGHSSHNHRLLNGIGNGNGTIVAEQSQSNSHSILYKDALINPREIMALGDHDTTASAMPPRPNAQALTELINRGMSLSKDEPQIYQYFKGARNMLAVRTEDQDKIIGLFWDIGSFQDYSKRLKTLIRLRRPDLILLNKLKCDVEPVYEFAKEQGYEATALAGFPISEGGVAILYDPRRIKMIKKNAGHFKEGDKSAIDWTWIEFSFASHYYRIISMYCKSECRKEDIRDVVKQIGEAERRRIFLMANFNRQGFTCNQMKNLVNGRPTYAKISKHEGQVVSAAYASRDGILCSAADSLHIEVENPREPFYACDAPDNGKFHFVINFAIQSDDD